jgi:molybdate transport system substrate-binding protein
MKLVSATCLVLAACSREEGPVAVYAASSLRDAVSEICAAWSERTGREARLQFDASSTLARQIREGAPADVFVCAAADWMDEVGPQDRFDWLGNRLVCVVPAEAPDPDVRSVDSLALAGEQVPAGAYARAALRGLDIPVPARIVEGSNARDVLSKVSQGAAPAGIVYATDAALDASLRVAFPFPSRSHPPIVYTAGLLRPAGRGLFEALRAPWALEIARRQGFTDPP